MGFSFVAVPEVLAQIGAFLPVSLWLFLLECELEVDPLLLADFGVAAVVLVVFEERSADLFRLLPQSIVGVFVLIEGKSGFVVNLAGVSLSLLAVDGGSVIECLAFVGSIIVLVGRVVCVFGVFAENSLVTISWLLVGRLSMLLLEGSIGRIGAGLCFAVELAEFGLQLVPHRV